VAQQGALEKIPACVIVEIVLAPIVFRDTVVSSRAKPTTICTFSPMM
jgi:hypothetical protein